MLKIHDIQWQYLKNTHSYTSTHGLQWEAAILIHDKYSAVPL